MQLVPIKSVVSAFKRTKEDDALDATSLVAFISFPHHHIDIGETCLLWSWGTLCTKEVDRLDDIKSAVVSLLESFEKEKKNFLENMRT